MIYLVEKCKPDFRAGNPLRPVAWGKALVWRQGGVHWEKLSRWGSGQGAETCANWRNCLCHWPGTQGGLGSAGPGVGLCVHVRVNMCVYGVCFCVCGVYIFICVCVVCVYMCAWCMYICVYVCGVYTCVWHTHMHVHMHMSICVYISTYVCSMYTCMYMWCICTYMHVYMTMCA